MNVLHLVTVVVVGFVGCAEFGSFAFVHPMLRRLPPTEWIQVEQGLLRTFGRVMPVGMTAAPILAGAAAASLDGDAATLGGVAAAVLVAALVTTVVVNVRINLATGTWDPASPPHDWRQRRRRWEIFQGIRASLQVVGFILVTAAVLTPSG